MSKSYEKPVILVNDDLAEGVYMASGSGSACYSASGAIRQVPETGRNNYVIQLNGTHHATDGHSNDAQTVTVSFNQNVTYVSSQGSLSSGSGTSTLVLAYHYHQNANDNIGLGDLVVESGPGLSITGVTISDGH